MKGTVTASTHEASIQVRARVSLSRYPTETGASKPTVRWLEADGEGETENVVCALTSQKLLAYAEGVQK